MQDAQAKDESLLEREASIACIQALIARASDAAEGGTVIVTGEPGLGKTALIEHCIASAASSVRCFVGGCEALATPRPLGPVHDFAADLSPVLRRMLVDGADRAALFARILEELVGAGGPALLVLEDVHWADAATLDLVKFIGRRIRRQRVLMLLSARDEPACETALAPLLADLPARQLTRIRLEPLSLQAVARMARADARHALALHGATGGNPFFLGEVLRGGGGPGRVPASVRDAVLARAARLEAPARVLLEHASLFPRQLSLPLLRALPVTIDALDDCIAAGLLRLDGATVRFRHELARVAIADALPIARARNMHSAALAALSAMGSAKTDPAQLAHHARLAWDTAAVARWAPEAARDAAARGALREAVAHCEAALEVGDAISAVQRAALLEAVGRSHFELNQLEAAAAAYRQAMALYAQQGLVEAQVRCLASLAMPLVRLLRNREADEAARAALDLAATLPRSPSVAVAHVTESYLRMLNRDYREAIGAAEKAIALAAPGDRSTLARAYETLGAASLFLDYDRGCALLHKSMQIAQDLPDGGATVADGHLMLSTASAELFELDAAECFLEEGIAFARGRDLDRQARYMEAWAALCDLYRGRWSAAGQRAEQVLEVEQQASTCRVVALVALGRLRTRRGDPGAQAVLDEALELAQRSGTLQRLAPVCLARAEAAWLRRDDAGALAEVERVEALARAKSHPWFVGELALWRRVLVPGAATVPRGCAAPYRLQLQGRWQEAAQDWHRRGCSYEQARALADGDEDAQRAALAILDQLGAAPLARRVREAMHASGYKVVPRGPVRATRAHPAGLTRREVEVLQLLAQDLRPAQIAIRLSRSVRTVDHHVEALYAKLDVSSRPQALARARSLGLLEEK